MANGSSVSFAVAKAILLAFVSPCRRLPEKKFQRKGNGSLGEDDKMEYSQLSSRDILLPRGYYKGAPIILIKRETIGTTKTISLVLDWNSNSDSLSFLWRP